MKKFILFTVLSLLFVFTAVVSAGSKKNIKQNKKQVNSTIAAFNNLSLAIDYWHDATLKADKKAVAEHLQMIYAIISEDIKAHYQSVSYAKLEASYSQDNSKNNNNIKVDKYNLQDEESNLKSKKLIFASLKKSKSFGYSYRLLADYQQLLKNEINANKIEIAEDVSQQKENAGQIRVIR